MSSKRAGRLAVVVRGEPTQVDALTSGTSRFAPLFSAFADVGLTAVPCMFSEGRTDEVRAQLLDVDLALVWVDPVSGSDDRNRLDAMLRDIADAGVVVSAHPDVIERMGTKDVLYATRDLTFGSDVDRYVSPSDFRARFPARLAASVGPRVLKQYRGNGGIGVWKVELLSGDVRVPEAARVRVQGARRREQTTEDMAVSEFIDRCMSYFAYNAGAGRLIDQPFQARVVDGLIRCYFVQSEVIGFCRQYPAGASHSDVPGPLADPGISSNTFGLPSAKTMFPPDEPAFARLRSLAETTWVPELLARVALDVGRLPLLWDADFLFGPLADDKTDSYVLCEINVSAVAPFPQEAPAKLADAAAATIARTRGRAT